MLLNKYTIATRNKRLSFYDTCLFFHLVICVCVCKQHFRRIGVSRPRLYDAMHVYMVYSTSSHITAVWPKTKMEGTL